jgi:hypothetical protein
MSGENHDLFSVDMSGGGGVPPGQASTSAIIYRPGVPTAEPAVATWAEVATAITKADGAITVFVDSTHAPAHVPAASGVTSCQGATTLAAYNNQVGSAPFLCVDVLTIDDGATLDRIARIVGFLAVLCDSKTTPSLTFNQTAGSSDALLCNDCALSTTLTATIPACEVTGLLSIGARDIVLGQAGTAAPMFHLHAGGTLSLSVFENWSGVAPIDTGAVTGPIGSTLAFAHDASYPLTTFPGFLGTVNAVDRSDLAQWVRPSADVTANRPAAPNVALGQMFFDTTLGSPVWWNGAAWVSAVAGRTTIALNTAAMAGSGQAAYVSAAGVASPTDASALGTAAFVGIYEGVAGQIQNTDDVADALFTTAGGSPGNGANVYLALASDDGGTAAGKLTATAPVGAGKVVTRVGICLDNTAYAGTKKARVLLQPVAPVQL